MARSTTQRTEEHGGPQRIAARRAREVLVVAFPHPRTLPVPLSGEPVGREWLAERGVIDTRVSGQHVEFTRSEAGLLVRDLGSRNGSWVNGTRLVASSPVPLADGAVVRLGRTLVVYRREFFGSDEPSPPLGQLVAPYGLRQVTERIAAICARRPTNVLIEGETGTGKELVARALAVAAGRAHKYADVNIAELAAGTFESQLFGYVAGAYSGSGKGSLGIFVTHEGGAVFLDEIGELSLDLQAKLLRVLENRKVWPVGANKPTAIDVLLITATNRVLDREVAENRFRQDLLARLAAARIGIPPLRSRIEDIWAIAAAHMLARGEPYDLNKVEVEAVERLVLLPWPSNVRQLVSVIEEVAMIEPPPGFRLEALEHALRMADSEAASEETGPAPSVEAIQEALAQFGNESAASRALGITRGRLRRLLRGAKK
jgi:transcriptional regulator of aromatic amino acid metabolism